MASTYSQLKIVLQEALERSHKVRQRLERAVNEINVSKTELDSILPAYNSYITELDTLAAASPDNMALQVLKAEKDQMLLDIGTLSTDVDAIHTAVNS